MAGAWHEYYELLLRDNLKLKTDNGSLQAELNDCHKIQDRYRIRIKELEAGLENKEVSFYFKSSYEDEVRRNEILRRERHVKHDLQKEDDILKQKLNWQEETTACYKEELSKYTYETEHQISELQERLKNTVNNLNKTETHLYHARNEKNIQLQSQKQRLHYLEKEIKRLNLEKKILEDDCQRNERKKTSAEWSNQVLLQNVKERDTQLQQTKFERDIEKYTIKTLERVADLDKKKIRSLTNKLECLGREFKCQNLKLQQQQVNLLEKEKNEEHEIIKATKALKEKDERISELTTQVIEALSTLKETKASYDNTQDDGQNQVLARKKLERKIEDGRMRIKELEGDLKVKEKQLYELNDQLQRALAKLNITEERLNKMKDVDLKARKDKTGMKDRENTNEQVISSPKHKIERLERETGQRDGKLDCQKKAGESTNVEVKNEMELLISDLKKKEDLLSKQSNQLQQALTKLKETEAKLYETTSERDHERHSRQNLERKATENHARLEDLKQVNEKITLSHKQQIDTLESEIERRDLKLKRLEDNRKTKAINEREMISDLKVKDDKISEQRQQLQQMLKTLKQTEAKLKETTTERDLEQYRRQELEGKAKENQTGIKLEQVDDEVVTSQKQRIQTLERELKRRDIKEKDLKAMLEKTKAEVGTGKELGHVLREREDKLAELEHQLKKILVKLKETETELEETKTRLSKAMGDRLTDNNPNIADLSDKNRPVKLAERFAELYDNQWTDAFDSLEKFIDGEQSTIEALLDILQDVMQFCITSGSKQIEDLQSVLGFSKANVGDVPIDVRKHLKDCRKAMSSIATRNLYEMYISYLKQTPSQTLGRALEVRKYVQECLEICWLMVIQDPPVVFAPVALSGSALDTELFKPYTSSGTHVDYTVWPALLLHEGGPVLAKGVAQGYGKKSSSTIK